MHHVSVWFTLLQLTIFIITKQIDFNLIDYNLTLTVSQDAFKYLTGLYMTLKKGGLLIFHDRYYDDKTVVDGDEYHPVRIKRAVLDRFLSGFKILFNNCSATYEGRPNERGYYIIAVKL